MKGLRYSFIAVVMPSFVMALRLSPITLTMARSGIDRRQSMLGLGSTAAVVATPPAMAAPAAAGVGIRGADPDGDPYQLPDLPYAYNALEPHIDEATMQFHHDKHHAKYVSVLNAARKGKPPVALAKLQKDAIQLGTAVRNGGGGHYNHCLFWQNMCPADDTNIPSASFRRALDKQFGGEDEMREQFSAEAAKVFGSGWCWLSVDAKGDMIITSTANQDNPLMNTKTVPLLGLDCWEHAYYLKFQNNRAAYVDAWWNVVNWRRVSSNYLQFALNGEPIPCTQGDLLAAPPPSFMR